MNINTAKSHIARSKRTGAASIIKHANIVPVEPLRRLVIRAQQLEASGASAELISRAQGDVINATSPLVCNRAEVKYLAWAKNLPDHAEFDDVFQAGCMGILRAITKFEPDRALSFTTYADAWIRNFIAREIYRVVGVMKLPERELIAGQIDAGRMQAHAISLDFEDKLAGSHERQGNGFLSHETLADPRQDIEASDIMMRDLLSILYEVDPRLVTIAPELACDKTHVESAKLLGVSRQRVTQIVRDGREALELAGITPSAYCD